MAVIDACGICKTVPLPGAGSLAILTGLDLRVDAGSTVVVRGRSGSGKTTLLSILGLLDVPTTGELHIAGVDVSGLSLSARALFRGANLGYVFQNYSLIPHYNALQNVMLPLLYAKGDGTSLRGARRRAREMLSAVGLADHWMSLPSQMSGGEQQRVAIARAMIRQPQVIFADEPTGALDGVTAEAVMSVLVDQTSERGMALVIVTHDRQIASGANVVFELRAGRLEDAGRELSDDRCRGRRFVTVGGDA